MIGLAQGFLSAAAGEGLAVSEKKERTAKK